MIQDISSTLAILGAVGWIFKVWIINPLNSSIQRLNEIVTEVKGTMEAYRQLTGKMAQDIAEAKAETRSANKRLDELQGRLHDVEVRCSECCRRSGADD